MTSPKNYVYVLARTEDRRIQDALVGFYSEIEGYRKRGDIDGLISISPLIPGRTLDELLADKPQPLIDEIYKTPAGGLAMFSEWESGDAIDKFVRGDLHRMLSEYAYTRAQKIILTVIQYREGKTTKRDIGGKLA